MAIDDQLAVLLAQNSELFAAYEEWANGQIMLLAGTVDDPNSFNEAGGQTGALGYYPVVNVSGQTIYVACLARLKAIALGGANADVLEGLVAQVGGKLTAVDQSIAAASTKIGQTESARSATVIATAAAEAKTAQTELARAAAQAVADSSAGLLAARDQAVSSAASVLAARVTLGEQAGIASYTAEALGGAALIVANGKPVGFSIPAGATGASSYVRAAIAMPTVPVGATIRVQTVALVSAGFYAAKPLLPNPVSVIYNDNTSANLGNLARYEQIGLYLYREATYVVAGNEKTIGNALQVSGANNSTADAHTARVVSTTIVIEKLPDGIAATGSDLALEQRLNTRAAPTEAKVASTEASVTLAIPALSDYAPIAPTLTQLGSYRQFDTGTAVGNAGWNTYIFDLTNVSFLRVTGAFSSANTSIAVWYASADATGAAIGHERQAGTTVEDVSGEVVKRPSGANSVAISVRAATGTAGVASTVVPIVAAATVAPKVQQVVAGLSSEMSSLRYWTAPAYALVSGYIDSNGVPTAGASWRYVVIAAAPGTRWRLTGSTTGVQSALVRHVSRSGRVLASQFAGDGNITGVTNQIITQVANGDYLAFTFFVGSGSTPWPPKIEFEGIEQNALGDLRTRVPAVEAKATRTDAEIGNVRAFYGVPLTGAANFYWNATTGVKTSAANWTAYDEIAVTAGETLKLTGQLLGVVTAMAIFVNGSTVIGSSGAGPSSPAVDYTDASPLVVTVPVGATGARITTRSASPATLKRFGVDPALAGIAARVASLEAGIGALLPVSIIGDSQAEDLATGLQTTFAGRSVYPNGLAGQRLYHVAARLNATPVTLAITGGQIPTSGSVAVVPSVDLLFRAGRTIAVSCRIMIAGIPCRLVCAGDSSTGTVGNYSITPITYPAAARPVPANAQISVTSGVAYSADPSAAPSFRQMLRGIVALRIGRNDTYLNLTPAWDIGSDQATIRKVLDVIRSYGGRPVLLGVTNGTYDLPNALGGTAGRTEAQARQILGNVAAINAARGAEWPDLFIDPLANHVALGGYDAVTVDGSAFNVLNATVLRDGIHENTGTGQPRTVALIKANSDAVGL